MILITGATGMTGHFVVKELNRRDVPIRLLVREASVDKVAGLDADIALGDLADFASLHGAMEGVAGVAHVACTFTDIAIDVAAMGVLLDCWREGPFVFVSSLDVYGLTEQNPITEEHPLSETYGDYGRGKVICERMLAAKAQAMGRSDFAMLRAPHIIGPHPKGQRFLRQVQLGEDIVLPGADEAEWSRYQDAWTDARDRAWVVAESVVKPPGRPLNVLTGHFVWHDFYAELIRLTGSSSQIVHTPLDEVAPEERDALKSKAMTWEFESSRLRQVLNFEPRFSLNQTLTDTVNFVD